MYVHLLTQSSFIHVCLFYLFHIGLEQKDKRKLNEDDDVEKRSTNSVILIKAQQVSMQQFQWK